MKKNIRKIEHGNTRQRNPHHTIITESHHTQQKPSLQIKKAEQNLPEMRAITRVQFNVDKLTKNAHIQIYLINKFLQIYSENAHIGIAAKEDTQQMQHVKKGYESRTNEIITRLLEMKRIQSEEILPRLGAISNQSPQDRKIQIELHNLTLQNWSLWSWILAREEQYEDSRKFLTENQQVKTDLLHAFSNRLISAEREMDIYIKNMGIVQLPEQFLKDHIITFQFETIEMKFIIVNVNAENGIPKTIDIVHLNPNLSAGRSTERYFKGIPLTLKPHDNFAFYLKNRVVFARNEIQKGVAKARERYIQQYGVENLKTRLRAYGLFTEEEIERMVGGKVEHSNLDIMREINLAEENVANKLRSMIDEHGKPNYAPIEYERRFSETLEKLISGIERSPITPEQKSASINAIQKLIISPITNAMKVFEDKKYTINNAPWAEWIRVLQDRIEKIAAPVDNQNQNKNIQMNPQVQRQNSQNLRERRNAGNRFVPVNKGNLPQADIQRRNINIGNRQRGR